jgi:prophage maintenance system killer protein
VHPFNDGNKRTAFLTSVIFLGLNGKDLDATETEVVQVMPALAAGTLTEAAMAKWIRERLVLFKCQAVSVTITPCVRPQRRDCQRRGCRRL